MNSNSFGPAKQRTKQKKQKQKQKTKTKNPQLQVYAKKILDSKACKS